MAPSSAEVPVSRRLAARNLGQGRGTAYLRVSAITGDLRTSSRKASSSLVSALVTLSFTATSSWTRVT